MAYSMFECPKLHNARSLKFYPEHNDHHVSFRHKTLPEDFSMCSDKTANTTILEDARNASIQPQTSRSDRKCPIYVHNLVKSHPDDSKHFGDFVKHGKPKKTKKQHVLEKLEESYWANWKPDNSKETSPSRKKKSPEIEVIKSAPPQRRKIKIFPQEEHSCSITKVHKITSKSQEIQTEDLSLVVVPPTICEETTQEASGGGPNESELVDKLDKFLKHTDSFILNSKKHKEDVKDVKFEQPRCIRLYKKPAKIASKNYVKGGSYPLKPCLKKESSFAKTNSTRFGRPGSPAIGGVASYFGKYKSFHKHHH